MKHIEYVARPPRQTIITESKDGISIIFKGLSQSNDTPLQRKNDYNKLSSLISSLPQYLNLNELTITGTIIDAKVMDSLLVQLSKSLKLKKLSFHSTPIELSGLGKMDLNYWPKLEILELCAVSFYPLNDPFTSSMQLSKFIVLLKSCPALHTLNIEGSNFDHYVEGLIRAIPDLNLRVLRFGNLSSVHLESLAKELASNGSINLISSPSLTSSSNKLIAEEIDKLLKRNIASGNTLTMLRRMRPETIEWQITDVRTQGRFLHQLAVVSELKHELHFNWETVGIDNYVLDFTSYHEAKQGMSLLKAIKNKYDLSFEFKDADKELKSISRGAYYFNLSITLRQMSNLLFAARSHRYQLSVLLNKATFNSLSTSLPTITYRPNYYKLSQYILNLRANYQAANLNKLFSQEYHQKLRAVTDTTGGLYVVVSDELTDFYLNASSNSLEDQKIHSYRKNDEKNILIRNPTKSVTGRDIVKWLEENTMGKPWNPGFEMTCKTLLQEVENPFSLRILSDYLKKSPLQSTHNSSYKSLVNSVMSRKKELLNNLAVSLRNTSLELYRGIDEMNIQQSWEAFLKGSVVRPAEEVLLDLCQFIKEAVTNGELPADEVISFLLYRLYFLGYNTVDVYDLTIGSGLAKELKSATDDYKCNFIIENDELKIMRTSYRSNKPRTEPATNGISAAYIRKAVDAGAVLRGFRDLLIEHGRNPYNPTSFSLEVSRMLFELKRVRSYGQPYSRAANVYFQNMVLKGYTLAEIKDVADKGAADQPDGGPEFLEQLNQLINTNWPGIEKLNEVLKKYRMLPNVLEDIVLSYYSKHTFSYFALFSIGKINNKLQSAKGSSHVLRAISEINTLLEKCNMPTVLTHIVLSYCSFNEIGSPGEWLSLGKINKRLENCNLPTVLNRIVLSYYSPYTHFFYEGKSLQKQEAKYKRNGPRIR